MNTPTTMEAVLRGHVLTREEVDGFLDPTRANWGVFDSELGYTLRTCNVQDGVGGSFTLGEYDPAGPRRMMHYAERPCRINTYGDSYTQCQQVSDGETWQEVLAAHFGEPVRNFGVGGYGVYQAYRRMRRVEAGPLAAEHVLLNVFGIDDHFRSMDAWRRPRCGTWFRDMPSEMFHANPWDHARIDLETGELREHASLCPTPASLYNLCDAGWVLETFRDDPVLNLFLAQQGRIVPDAKQLAQFGRLAELLDVRLDPGVELVPQLKRLYTELGVETTCRIIQWAREWAAAHGRKLMILLSHGCGEMVEGLTGQPRYDQRLLDYLQATGQPFADVLPAHGAEFATFRLQPGEYVRRYCIPHYNPQGNHFFAFAIKDALVNWLNPRPRTYATPGETMQFEGYLPTTQFIGPTYA